MFKHVNHSGVEKLYAMECTRMPYKGKVSFHRFVTKVDFLGFNKRYITVASRDFFFVIWIDIFRTSIRTF